MLRFDLDGQTFEFNDDKIVFAEFRYLKAALGLASGDFLIGLRTLDVEALAGMILLTMKRRGAAAPSGKPFTVADLDEIDMSAIIVSVSTHKVAESEFDAAALAADVAAVEVPTDAELQALAARGTVIDVELQDEPAAAATG